MMPQIDQALVVRIARMEVQMERYTADLESEKATRSRANSDIHTRLDRIEENQERNREEYRKSHEATNRILYMMLGGLAVVQVVIQFIRH